MAARVYWLWLATRRGVDARCADGLLRYFGDPEEIYTADRPALLAYGGLKGAQVDALCDKDLTAADRILEKCAKMNIHILTRGDSGYPERLLMIEDPPVVLYWRGVQPAWDVKPMISIVGTRKGTAYGEMMAERFAQGLTEAGFLVVSGMAEGVDGAAGRGALRAGSTIAVLGCGVDVCYPMQNEFLFGDILLTGTLISEYPPGTEPLARHFPVRNRIISGLSVATIVVEAPERSGALITANLALNQGRDVYAVPGRIDDAKSAGCNALIRDHAAQMLTDPVELVRDYSHLLPAVPDEARVRQVFRAVTGEEPKAAEPAPEREKPSLWDVIESRRARGNKRRSEAAEAKKHDKPAPPLPADLSENERRVLEAVRAGAGTADQIVEATGMNVNLVLSVVTMLELDALLTNEGGHIILNT